MSLLERAAGWLVNPMAGVSDDRLADAVAGKVVIVTGASRGIGEATARRLGSAGARIVLAARSSERLSELASEIDGAVPFATDLSDPEQAEALASFALEEFGHVDVLVANAGKSINRSIARAADEGRFHDYQRTAALNYLGPVALVLALVPSMRSRGAGHIVNVSTAGLLAPAPVGWSAYIASKVAFHVFLRSAQIELADDGITVNTVYMTLVHTDMSAPTNFGRLPGLTPEEAADRVCAAVTGGSGRVAPVWALPASMAAGLSQFGLDQGTRLYYRVQKEAARRRRSEP